MNDRQERGQARRRAATCWSAGPRTPASWWCTAMPGWSPTTKRSSWSRTSSRMSRSRTAASSPSTCARATAGPTASRSPARISATGGRTSPTTTQLSPTGPPAELFVDGEAPKVEFLDPLTVRYSWSKPNPFFLPALAGATPHLHLHAGPLPQAVPREDTPIPTQLAAKVEEAQARDWAQLHGRKDGMYNFDNPDLPTLQPWRSTTPPPATRFVFDRNAYFHRVDPNGQQLPYIDRVVLDVVDDKLIPVKTGAGETDLQSRGLFFKHYTFLKESQARSHLDTYLWETAHGAHVALYPNLNANDEVWRKLFRDVRFRRALSLAVDRDEINQIMYFGLGDWRRQHRPAQEPAVQAGVSRHLGTVRSGPGQRAARRDRADRALGRRPASAAGRPADGDHRRDGRRGDGAVGRSGAGARNRGSSSASGSIPSRPSARCSATACSPATP